MELGRGKGGESEEVWKWKHHVDAFTHYEHSFGSYQTLWSMLTSPFPTFAGRSQWCGQWRDPLHTRAGAQSKPAGESTPYPHFKHFTLIFVSGCTSASHLTNIHAGEDVSVQETPNSPHIHTHTHRTGSARWTRAGSTAALWPPRPAGRQAIIRSAGRPIRWTRAGGTSALFRHSPVIPPHPSCRLAATLGELMSGRDNGGRYSSDASTTPPPSHHSGLRRHWAS